MYTKEKSLKIKTVLKTITVLIIILIVSTGANAQRGIKWSADGNSYYSLEVA